MTRKDMCLRYMVGIFKFTFTFAKKVIIVKIKT